MEQSIIYNNVILNNLFAPREFKFINQIDTDIDKIDALISKEQSNKDIITIFIDNLHNMIATDKFPTSKDKTTNFISEVKNILNLVNDNIEMLQTNKQNYDKIKKSIIDLLVKAEYESTSANKYNSSSEMKAIRTEINAFSVTLENTKSQIFLNDIKIDNFFNKEIVKKYLLYCSSGLQNLASVEQSQDLNGKDTDSLLSNENTEIVPDVSTDSPINNETILDNNTSNFSKEDTNKYYIKNVQESSYILIVSEKNKKVYLPYSKQEVLAYLEQYPTQYKSFSDVVEQEFIFPIDFYLKHPVVSRFREAYSLLRDRESKPVLESLKFALDVMFNYNLNPAVIAACKSQDQLENYLFCVQHKKLENFKDFEIKFDVAPIG